MRWKIILNALLVIGLLTVATLAVSQPAKAIGVSFEWGSWGTPPNGGEYGVYEADDTTPLLQGDRVQLIWTGPDGEIDPPQTGGSTSDDDQILDTNYIDTGSFPPPFLGQGFFVLQLYDYDTEDPESGGIVYVRGWNDSNPAAATAYGDSETETLNGAEIGQQWNVPRWTMQYNHPTAVTLGAFGSSVLQTSILPWAGFGILCLGTLSTVLFRRRSGG